MSGGAGPGVVQAYSRLAKRSFQLWALAKYGDAAGVAAAWSRPIADDSEVRVPEPSELADMFARGEHVTTERGRDLFDWYRHSLLDHGRRVLGAAADVFQASAFRGVRLSASNIDATPRPHPKSATRVPRARVATAPSTAGSHSRTSSRW